MKFTHLTAMAGVFAAILVVLSPTLSAQEGRRGGRGGWRGGGDPVLGLLRIEEVRTELEISEEQNKAVRKIAEDNRPERPNFRDKSDEERSAMLEKMREDQAAAVSKIKEQLEEVLLPEQMTRLQQISIQIQGVRALNNKEVAEKLGVSEEQQESLRKAQEEQMGELRNKMREIFTGGGDREGMREKMMELQKNMQSEVLKVLTDDQKKMFEEMKGEQFDMPQRQWGGRRGRDGGRGRGRGGRGGRGGNGEGGGRGPSRPEIET